MRGSVSTSSFLFLVVRVVLRNAQVVTPLYVCISFFRLVDCLMMRKWREDNFLFLLLLRHIILLSLSLFLPSPAL